MVPYVVRQGDYLAALAFRMGFDADAVWNDAENAALRQRRVDPNMLAPGDVLRVPARDERAATLTLGAENAFVAQVPTTTVSVVILRADEPCAGGEAPGSARTRLASPRPRRSLLSGGGTVKQPSG